jgi:hypothetical protein
MNKSADFSCSLYKLQLKFVQTTRVVCTDFAEVCRIGSAISIHVTLYNRFYYSILPKIAKAAVINTTAFGS